MNNSPYSHYLREHRRLVILRALAEVPGYSLNSSIIGDILIEYRLEASRDQVHSELAWLAEQGLIETDEVSTVRTARLTQRGADVAAGVADCPGVKRPGPGA